MKILHGDDFNFDQIKEWYIAESEGYSGLGNDILTNYAYEYHELNKFYGFRFLNEVSSLGNVLGMGSAWGYEFEPVISKVSNIFIIEPSDNMINSNVGNVIPRYVKPNLLGNLDFPDNTFDLITCFGTLHHIPNVSFVLSEMIRVLKPGSLILLREPIVSMGDWTKPRVGLTKNERGLPYDYLVDFFSKQPIDIISINLCFTLTSFINRIYKKFFGRSIYKLKYYIYFDWFVSKLFSFNKAYYRHSFFSKLGPTSIYCVLKKR